MYGRNSVFVNSDEAHSRIRVIRHNVLFRRSVLAVTLYRRTIVSGGHAMNTTSEQYNNLDGSQIGKMQCQLNSYYDAEYVLRSIVYVITTRAGMDDKHSNRVALAVDELYANIAKHGYDGKPGRGEFDARIHKEADGQAYLYFTFRDYADHAAHEKLKALINDPGEKPLTPGGRGLMMISAVMDRLEHRALAVGNYWCLVCRCGRNI